MVFPSLGHHKRIEKQAWFLKELERIMRVVGILSGYMIEENPSACQLSESVLYVIRFNFKRCICLEIIS